MSKHSTYVYKHLYSSLVALISTTAILMSNSWLLLQHLLHSGLDGDLRGDWGQDQLTCSNSGL